MPQSFENTRPENRNRRCLSTGIYRFCRRLLYLCLQPLFSFFPSVRPRALLPASDTMVLPFSSKMPSSQSWSYHTLPKSQVPGLACGLGRHTVRLFPIPSTCTPSTLDSQLCMLSAGTCALNTLALRVLAILPEWSGPTGQRLYTGGLFSLSQSTGSNPFCALVARVSQMLSPLLVERLFKKRKGWGAGEVNGIPCFIHDSIQMRRWVNVWLLLRLSPSIVGSVPAAPPPEAEARLPCPCCRRTPP